MPLSAKPPTSEPGLSDDRFSHLEEHLSTEIGARLRRAREEKRLSQKELGQALDYGATMISAFETGRRRMKLEDLARACIVLDREPEYFLGTEEKLRRDAPVGLTLRAELVALPEEQLAKSIEAFLDEAEDQERTDGQVPDLSHLRPEAAAQEVLRLAGVDEPPIEMKDICQELGIPLYWRKLPDSLSALVVSHGTDGFVIGVNQRHAPTRRRFSIAHEVGHAVLRHEASYYLEYAVDDAGEPPGYRYFDEREANGFAAALLMDEHQVREDFASGIRDVRDLADRYEVSKAAMGFRLVNLGLA